MTAGLLSVGGTVSGPAHAAAAQILSGSTCSPITNCVYVLGAGTRIDSIRGRASMPYPNTSKQYHFELWASGWHYNTPDQVWTGTIWPGYAESGWKTVNRTVPAGSGACSRLWVKMDGTWRSYDGSVCLKITA